MRSKLNNDVNAKVKQLPQGQDQTRTSVQRPNFYIQAKIKLGLQYKGQSTTLRSRSKLDFSVKVKPLPRGQDQTRTS